MQIHRDKLNEVGAFAPPNEWHTPRIPGYGEMDWGKFMAALRVAGNVLRPYCVG